MANILGRGGYDYGAYNDLREFKIFSENVKALGQKNYDDILFFLKEYQKYYEEHGSYEGIPEDLKKGVTICAGIHEFIAEFLRVNGMQAYAITVNTKTSPHVVALAFYNENGANRVAIIDYGNRYVAKSGSLDDALKIYSQVSGVPILQTQIFGRGGRYYGTYVTQAGKLMQKTTGTYAEDIINSMLNNGPKKGEEKIAVSSPEIYVTEEELRKESKEPAPSTPEQQAPEQEPTGTQEKEEKVAIVEKKSPSTAPAPNEDFKLKGAGEIEIKSDISDEIKKSEKGKIGEQKRELDLSKIGAEKKDSQQQEQQEVKKLDFDKSFKEATDIVAEWIKSKRPNASGKIVFDITINEKKE